MSLAIETTPAPLDMPYDHALPEINNLTTQIKSEMNHEHREIDNEASLVIELSQLVKAEKDGRELVQQMMKKHEVEGTDHAVVEREIDDAEAELLLIHSRVCPFPCKCHAHAKRCFIQIRQLEKEDSDIVKTLSLEASKIREDRQRLKEMRDKADVEALALDEGPLA